MNLAPETRKPYSLNGGVRLSGLPRTEAGLQPAPNPALEDAQGLEVQILLLNK